MTGSGRHLSWAAAAAGALALVCASPALASTQRFVAPGGDTGLNDCTNVATPCDLTRALNIAAAGDEVILAVGTYTLGGTGLSPGNVGLDIHGPPNTQTAQIQADTTGPALSLTGDHLHDVSISQAHAGQPALLAVGGTGSLENPTGLYENLRISATGTATGVKLTRPVAAGNIAPVLRNSVVTSVNASALVTDELNAGTVADAQINNVDAKSTSSSALNFHGGSTNAATVTLINDILDGPLEYTGGAQTETLNFIDCAQTTFTDGAITGTDLTGSAMNSVTDDPALVGGGDFHETSLSPTINTGTVSDSLGVGGVDLDGGQRQAGSNPDIGADEFAAAPHVFTDPVTAIGETSATLNGHISPGDGVTTYHFNYGTGASTLTSQTPDQTTPATNDEQAASAPLSGLVPGTKYFFELVGANENDDRVSTLGSFTTHGTAPGSGSAGGGGGGGGVAKLSVKFRGGKQKLKRHKLVFTLTASGDVKATGTVTFAGKKLAKFSKSLHSGANKLSVKLNKKALKALTKALKKHKTLSLKLKVALTGAASQTFTLKLTR